MPLWLAILLKKQRRANIAPPPWLSPHSLNAILDHETQEENAFSPPPRLPPAPSNDTLAISPPFLPGSTVEAAPDALPYHWLDMGEMLLEAAADDFEDSETVRKLLQGLREVRMAKLRGWSDRLTAASGVKMNGIGGMEVSEARPFVTGVIDNLRKFVATREEQRLEREQGQNGYGGPGRSSRTPYTQYTESTAGHDFDDDDDEMDTQ